VTTLGTKAAFGPLSPKSTLDPKSK